MEEKEEEKREQEEEENKDQEGNEEEEGKKEDEEQEVQENKGQGRIFCQNRKPKVYCLEEEELFLDIINFKTRKPQRDIIH